MGRCWVSQRSIQPANDKLQINLRENRGMRKPGWNPIKRNRKIGTGGQGFSKNNKLVIPQKWSDLTVFWERLKDPIINTINIKNHAINFLVEPTKQGYIHSCTVDDIIAILKHLPKRDLALISLIILRQPKRKEEIINPAWGRFVYYAKIGKYSGPGIYLEAQPINDKLKWSISLTPHQEKELHRHKKDGHIVTKDRRYFYIQTSPETVRNTQLFRTLPHEIGHAINYSINSQTKFSGANSYNSKPAQDKEEFAHRYAEAFRKKLIAKKIIPFDKILNREGMKKMRLNMEWFNHIPRSNDLRWNG